jgi:hypothetical protein
MQNGRANEDAIVSVNLAASEGSENWVLSPSPTSPLTTSLRI